VVWRPVWLTWLAFPPLSLCVAVHNGTVRDVFDLYIESGDGVDDPNRKMASRAQSHAKALENFKSREKGRKKKAALANVHGEEE